MKRLAWRTLAKLWQQWRLRQLHAQIEIHRQLLYEARTELAALRELEGEALLLRFGSYTREELAPFFRQQKRWERFVEDLFIVSAVSGARPEVYCGAEVACPLRMRRRSRA